MPRTLNQLFRMAALAEARTGALLRPVGSGWRPISDARLDRRVCRLALYLRDIFEIMPGDRVAIASELRHEWLLADLAVMSLGAVSVAVEPDLPAEMLAAAIRDAAPRLLFVSRAVLASLHLVYGHVAPLIPVVAFDGAVSWGGPVPLASAIDVGGALETPGRIRLLRRLAWETDPGSAAFCQYVGYLDGHTECIELSHSEACREVMARWTRPYARAGEVSYFVGSEVTLRARLALYAAIGDGLSTIAFGTPGREFIELADLRPGKVVGPPSFFAQALRVGQATPSPRARSLTRWIRGALHRAPADLNRAERAGLVAALGGRARWVGPTAPLDPELAARLSALTAVGPDSGDPAGNRGPA